MMRNFEDFKPVRNYMRKFSRRSVIWEAVKHLHQLYGLRDNEWRTYAQYWPPFFMLKIIEWALWDEKMDDTGPLVGRREFNRLINKTHEFHNTIEPPYIEHLKDVTIVARRAAVQQFWLQEKLYVADLGRHSRLYRDSGKLEDQFRHVADIDLRTFLELSFAFISHFYEEPEHVIKPQLIEEYGEIYGHQSVQSFLDLVSGKTDEIGDFLRNPPRKVNRRDWRFYEQSRLRRFPFWYLADEDRYLCFAPHLVHQLLRHFVYDLMKWELGEDFTDPFSVAFEEYVSELLQEFDLRHYREGVLQSLPTFDGNARKAVDFLLCADGANFLVESKAVELSPLAGVAPYHTPLHNHLSDSVVKALVQIYETVDGLLFTCREAHPDEFDPNQPFYALIVTYKPLYLGRTDDFIRGETEQELNDALRKAEIDPDILDRANVFFVDIGELEKISGTLPGDGKLTLKTFLDRCRQMDAKPSSRRMLMGQHVHEMLGIPTVPTFLQEKSREVTDDLLKRVRRGQSAPKRNPEIISYLFGRKPRSKSV